MKNLAIGFFASAIAGLGLWTLATHSKTTLRFDLEDLRISSESPDVENRARALLKPYLGASLFSLRLPLVRKNLMSIPRIESVEIHRRWPDTLVVQIVERDAVALAFRGEKLSLLDRNGNWIEELRSPKGLPLIVGASSDQIPLGDICQWLYSIQSAGEPDLLSYSKIDEIHWSREVGLRIKSAALGLSVYLGYRDFSNRWERAQKSYFFSYQRGRIARKIDAENLRRVILSGDEQAKVPASEAPIF
jgi:hypothetical protein